MPTAEERTERDRGRTGGGPEEDRRRTYPPARREGGERRTRTPGVLAGGFEGGNKGVAGAVALLWRAFSDLPLPGELQVLLGRLFSGEGLYLHAH